MLTDTLSPREIFTAVLFNGPLLRSDAVVVLCGEDAEHRANVGIQLLQQQAAPRIVLSGGLHTPPSRLGAAHLRTALIGKGVTPERILVDDDSLNTRDQAVHVVRLAVEQGWRRLLLAVSPYHAPRAYLTFVKALREAEQQDVIRVVVVPASQTAWFASPDGVSRTRVDLLALEAEKVERHPAHVATYEEGLAYLESWEGR